MIETIFTQFAALLSAALLIPICLFAAYGVTYRNMPFWSTASLACFLILSGTALAAVQNILPDLAVPVFSNALIGAGYLFCLRSVRMVKTCWKFHRADLVLLVVYILSLLFVVSQINTYPARVALVSSFIALISFAVFLVVLNRAFLSSRLGDAALLAFAFGNTLFATMRAVTALMGGETLLLSFVLWDQAFFIWSITAVFCFTIGLFLNGTALIHDDIQQALEKQRVMGEALSVALEGQRNLQKLILHELRRPLNALTTAVELSRQEQTGMSRAEVERIHQLISLASDYLMEIADYEDINALFDSPVLTEVWLSGLIDDIRHKWQVTIHVSDEAAGASLTVDLLLFDIAIGNLVENARKFGRNSGNIEVKVDAGANDVSFDVTDDGPGIPLSEAETVFRQFYKVDKTHAKTIKGWGLGLYVVRRIAEVHGGICRVVSRQPSTLRLSLPRSPVRGNTDE
jgi:signal transduction histidine kinase